VTAGSHQELPPIGAEAGLRGACGGGRSGDPGTLWLQGAPSCWLPRCEGLAAAAAVMELLPSLAVLWLQRSGRCSDRWRRLSHASVPTAAHNSPTATMATAISAATLSERAGRLEASAAPVSPSASCMHVPRARSARMHVLAAQCMHETMGKAPTRSAGREGHQAQGTFHQLLRRPVAAAVILCPTLQGSQAPLWPRCRLPQPPEPHRCTPACMRTMFPATEPVFAPRTRRHAKSGQCSSRQRWSNSMHTR
jgi:hypothetical protein